MKDLRISRRHVLMGIGAMGVVGALSGPTAAFAWDNGEIRWDIVTTSATVTPGGNGSAKASDGSMITMTGSGTFVPGNPDHVTGGGTWKVTAANGSVTESGTYQVRRLVSFIREPKGALPPGTKDLIGNAADALAGLALFDIAYSNGSTGALVFSCMLPGSPSSVLEGITATMGFVAFSNSVMAPITIFHTLH